MDANTKRELGLDFRDDGEFYMNFNRDFLKVRRLFTSFNLREILYTS